MESKVLTTEQREQAGSDSYNRFEYQVHWIVCHIVEKLHEKSDCIVFCEFHDDMAEFSPINERYQFFQIKTKDNSGKWTIAEMSKKETNRKGGRKKSFLGFIFYNFWKFSSECSHCYFVSNNSYDQDILSWQSYIEDNKILKKENRDLYNKIKNRIREEYSNDMTDDNFNSVFDVFIQNTFITKSALQLVTYEQQTRGIFFEYLYDKKILADTASHIFQQLLNDVRKKSKEKIEIPISKKRLIEKKGIEISQIGKKIKDNIINIGNYDDFRNYLISKNISENDVDRIDSAKKLHDARRLDICDIKYADTVLVLSKVIAEYCSSAKTNEFPDELNNLCLQELNTHHLTSDSIDKSLVEVLYYEYKFIRNR